MTESRPKSLEEWLFLLENQHQQEIQLGLTRVSQVADELHLLCPDAIVITVAGTNGKGSTVALLESIYSAAGYAVGSYTSPHLISFNERIRVHQQTISDTQLVDAFEAVEKTAGFTNLTYFEATTLAALWHFKQHSLDVIILEVGLGGRLDATNIINCDLAVITTIAIDHEAYLGNTRDAIGFEKAGILREKTPFIYADYDMPPSILHHAEALKTPVYRNGQEYSYETADGNLRLYFEEQCFELPLSSFHTNSVAAALMASICLRDELPVSHSECVQGITNTILAGRQQLITKHCQIVFDVAHNSQAASYLARHLSSFNPEAKVHAVFSALSDKDLSGLISPLKPFVDCWYPAILPGKRAATPTQLSEAFEANDVNEVLCYNNPHLAFDAACSQASTDDLIVVYGSFIIVGLILSTLSNPLSPRR